MKKIEAIIRPERLERVKAALSGIAVDSITVTEIRGHGRQKGHTDVYRGAEYTVEFVFKMKVEVVVPKARAEQVIHAISEAAWSGQIGDGKIFVTPVQEAIRIRNGDRGEDAL